MSVSQPALTPSTVSRRRFLTVAGAGVTTSALLTMLDARQAPAQIKGTTLRILQWSHFIPAYDAWRSEEHTSELQSQSNLECRLLLEKKQYRRRGRIPDADPLANRRDQAPGAPRMPLLPAGLEPAPRALQRTADVDPADHHRRSDAW